MPVCLNFMSASNFSWFHGWAHRRDGWLVWECDIYEGKVWFGIRESGGDFSQTISFVGLAKADGIYSLFDFQLPKDNLEFYATCGVRNRFVFYSMGSNNEILGSTLWVTEGLRLTFSLFHHKTGPNSATDHLVKMQFLPSTLHYHLFSGRNLCIRDRQMSSKEYRH